MIHLNFLWNVPVAPVGRVQIHMSKKRNNVLFGDAT